MASTADRLGELNSRYRRDAAFSHLRETGSYFVPGDGPINARVVVVGEAPGRQENLERRPFAGRSGGVLDRMLSEYAGIRRDQCYVTNVLKYRPPDNRDPDEEEIAAGRWYVGQEVVAIGAGIVVLVGRVAYTMVFPEGSISRDHGKAVDHKGRVYLPTYHPAVALYNPLMIDELRKDFSALRALLVDRP